MTETAQRDPTRFDGDARRAALTTIEPAEAKVSSRRTHRPLQDVCVSD